MSNSSTQNDGSPLPGEHTAYAKFAQQPVSEASDTARGGSRLWLVPGRYTTLRSHWRDPIETIAMSNLYTRQKSDVPLPDKNEGIRGVVQQESRSASSLGHDRPRRRRLPDNSGNYRGKWRNPIELVVAGALSGSSFLFLRVAAPVFGPVPVIELRLAIAALVLAPFLWRARAQLAAAGWLKIALIGAFNTIVPWLLFAWSSERAPAGVNAIVFSMSVPFTALTAFLTYGERMCGRRALGMLAGLVGVAVLSDGDFAGAGIASAVAVGTLASFLFGGASNLVRRNFAGVPAAALLATILASNALLLAPFAVWTWPSSPVSLRAWTCAVLLAIVGTAITYVLYFRLIQRIGAPRASTIAYLIPAFGVLWAWLALGEPLTISMSLGGALILGGMLLGRERALANRYSRSAPLDAPIRPGAYRTNGQPDQNACR